MQIRNARFHARVAAVAVAMACAAIGIGFDAAAADDKAGTQKTAGKFVKWDQEGGTVTVKEKGKDVVFAVIAEGSVLTRTTVTVKAKPAKLGDLKEGQIVQVYWKPSASDATKKDARKIDAVSLPEGVEPDEDEY